MPSMGVELLDPKVEGWDLRVAHAGLTASDCDVAHLHGLYWSADYRASSWEYKSNARIVEAIRMAKEVTVPSAWVAEVFQRDMRFTPHIIPHGIEWEEWRHSKESQGFVLWNKNRRFDVCDPAPVSELAKRFKNVQFVATFARPPVPGNVKEIGVQSHEDMKELIQTCGVYLSLVKETFCIGNLEAMASGVPILGFANGGNLIMVEHGVNGYLATPGDFDDLAQGLAYCFENWATLGANGREMAKNYPWEVACEKAVEVYKLAMKEEEPTVSIIIPSYNYADKVGRAIEGARHQSYNNIMEIIVVDDGSDDTEQLEKVVGRFRQGNGRESGNGAIAPDVRLIRQENQGVASARNTGIRESRSKYICCLDADDAIEPQFIEACIEGLQADRSLGVAYTGLRWIKPDGSTGVSKWPEEFDYDQQIQRKNQIPTCCVFRREMWERLGGYKSRYAPSGAGSEDAEFWTRAGSIGYRAKKVTTAPLFIYSWKSGHTSQQGYSEVDWLAWHPWVKDQEHPFASVATPKNKMSHAVRQYDEPMISVIIPVGPGHFNPLSIGVLESALDSLEAQTFRKWEAIISWDYWGSPDEDVPVGCIESLVRKSYPYVRMTDTRNEKGSSKGSGYARNRGVEIARAPFLLFLDADDWLHPTCMDEMLKGWRDEDAIIYTDYIEKTVVHDPEKYKAELIKKRKTIYKEDGHDFIVGRQSHEYDYERAIRQPDMDKPYLWNLVTSLVPKGWHEAIGGFDENMESWEDWDYYIRMAKAGRCFKRIPKELITYRFTTGKRRYLASADTPSSRQLARKLVEYLIEKYKDIEVVMCKCGSKKNRRSVPTAMASQALNKSNGRETMSDEDFVMAKYLSPNKGQHPVTGGVTKRKYGYRAGGDEFLVEKDDINGQPHLFQAIEGLVQVPVIVRDAPSKPRPITESVPPREASWLSQPIDEGPEEIDDPLIKLQMVPGITKEIAEQMYADGVKDGDDILMLGEEKMLSYRGIGKAKYLLITQAIEKLRETV